LAKINTTRKSIMTTRRRNKSMVLKLKVIKRPLKVAMMTKKEKKVISNHHLL
jgi:hypothetical protein